MKINKHYEYEKNIIDVILNIIKDNQEYLTLPENLTQLAKLGYMYNLLWYAGRRCWGYEGKLRGKAKRTPTKEEKEEYEGYDDDITSYSDCEDNAKYKIEMCEPLNEDIENLIYDAWGMHVENDMKPITFNKFSKLIKEGKELSELDKKSLKINKTFDEWVEILTDKKHRYSSLATNRKSVANHLLCTIGNGYGINKDGFIIEEAGGADQDKAIYGDWQNAIFREDIQKIIYDLLEIPELQATINKDAEISQSYIDKRKKEDNKINKLFYSILKSNNLYNDNEGELDNDEIHNRMESIESYSTMSKKEEYSPYSNISSYSIIYKIIDKEIREREGILNVDKSYLDEGIRICKEIIEHEKEETEGGSGNVIFAKKFLIKMGFNEYENQVEKEIDKYALEKEIINLLKPLTENFTKCENFEPDEGEYYFYFNNTAKNNYADNSYKICLHIDGSILNKGYSNTVDTIKNLSFYSELKINLEKISKLDGIKTIKFYIDNPYVINNYEYPKIVINFLVKDFNDELEFENYLTEKGFEIGENTCLFKLKDDIICITNKPKVLGKTHPHTKTGLECFSLNHQFKIINNNGDLLCDFNIDERRVNIIQALHGKNTDLSKWIILEYSKMKSSNNDYGTRHWVDNNLVGKDGKECLYAHDFFIWLKDKI